MRASPRNAPCTEPVIIALPVASAMRWPGDEQQADGRQRHVQEGRQGVFRGTRAAALCQGLVALGPWGGWGDLGPLLRLEPRPGERLRRDADRALRDRGHILGPRLQPRRNVTGRTA